MNKWNVKKNPDYRRSLILGLRLSLWGFPTTLARTMKAPLFGLLGYIGSFFIAFGMCVGMSLYVLFAGLFGYLTEEKDDDNEENQPTS